MNMSAVESSVISREDYAHEVLRLAEGQLLARAVHATLDRRSFLKVTGLAGAGLVLAFYVGNEAAAQTSGGKPFAPNAFVSIAGDGTITITASNPEIGQGVKTSMPMIVAEELDADWAHVKVVQAPVNAALYGRQVAGGSRSIPTNWDSLRRAGATARAMLVTAAAKQWQVPEAEITTAKSVVSHAPSGKSATYGELAAAAAALPVPDQKSLKLKERKDYTLLGQRITGVDNEKLVRGEPLFGIDQAIPNMHYAVFEKCPAVGGKVKSFNVDEIKSLPGVTDAFIVQGTGKPTEVMPGVAIIARSTWAAINAKRKLKVEWDESEASKDSWSQCAAQAQELAKLPQGEHEIKAIGDFDKALGEGTVVEGFYSYPFIPHAPLEPQNTTAHWKGDSLEIWSPTQMPDPGMRLVANVVGLPLDKITVHQTRVGGGFGRRLMNDYMCEAAQIAKQAGVPIKLQWTREDDMQHDFYRPGGFHAFKGAVDQNGKLIAFGDHFITFSSDGKRPVSSAEISPEEFPALLVPNVKYTQSLLNWQIPTGPWRAPRSNSVAFAVQSFLHELSTAAKKDHLEFLLELMGEPRHLPPATDMALNTGRAAAVIKLAAEKAGWGKPLPKGHGMGLAFHFSHAGHFAEVAEVSVDANRKLTVHKITVAGDIGPIINMSGAENQVVGSVIDGFSTMLGLELSIENGRIQETNFDRYPILRIAHAPPVEAHFIQSDYAPTGAGEPALPPLAPAICNAIFAATGHRVRTLPLKREGFTV
jgi:isoquinoline 1-oxidoreductase beta subunit